METRRCGWPGDDPLYIAYHDQEWGVPVHDDRTLFEFLITEGAQAGLSWITILRKRTAYIKLYDNFHPEKVASYGEKKILSLLDNPGIVRNKLKVRSSVSNAKVFLELQKEFGSFDSYLWNWVDGQPVVGKWKSHSQIPATTPLSDALSKDLKKRGFSFIGSTIIYAYLQAVGVVNDHITGCFRYEEITRS
ncbi:MAG: DNA-3-methyladenine glycosylase I [Spirochaetales bacterium]|jgi:DNA-3-methyladenine glycosylase I|nr:DNA-3-methyladenine glycosylase I [Spirochaetales bacterium]